MREASWSEARTIASHSFHQLQSESSPLVKSIGRTLASDLHSRCDLPAFETSSMDGWAVCGDGPWTIVGEVQMGKAPTESLSSGESMKISTGGVVPSGATAVLPWENATESDDYISGVVNMGDNIRPAGLESKTGDLLAKEGTSLTPPLVGLIAATGHDSVEVVKKPRIAFFFLGDELLHEGVPLNGAIRDALGPQLPGLLEHYGCETSSINFVEDDLNVLNSRINSALDNADIIITTGGTADGPRDFVKPAIAQLRGEYLIDCVKVRPGYHILVAKIKHSGREIPFIALPGNPQSALAAFTSFGKPIVDSLLGRAPLNYEDLRDIALQQNFKTQSEFSRLVPGNLEGNVFTPTEYLGSAMLRGVAFASGFALVSLGGATAKWLPLPTFTT
jgi:molybdopterin molybdotransferase